MALLVGLMASAVGRAQAAQRIVLRNLKIINDKKVSAFDEDGVRLEGGRVIPWDQIERASIAPAKQAAFDRMLADLGDHLYRIRRRLETGDYKSAPSSASGAAASGYKSLLSESEAVYPRYVGRRGKTAYMVFQGLMWARLEAGLREQALEPYLDCYGYLRAVGQARAELPGKRRLRLDLDSGVTPEIAPVWFDSDAAKEAMPKVLAAVSRMKKPVPEGTRIYYGTLALAAGDHKTGLRVLGGIKGNSPIVAQLRDVALAQREVLSGSPGEAVGQLEALLPRMDPSNRPLATYWLGMARVASKQPDVRRRGVLRLLYLPAIFGKAHPELAAAGLYQASKTLAELKDQSGPGSLRRELLDRYGQTYHAAKLKAELSPHQDNEVKP